jgi:Tol biopolymer transport system component
MHQKNGTGQDLVKLPADRSEPEILVKNFKGVHSTLDRDMKRVITDAFNYPEKGEASVLMYDLETGKQEVLCKGKQNDFDHTTGCHMHPQWSSDESRIYFNMADTGNPQLYNLIMG